jgi:hypothetical protein
MILSEVDRVNDISAQEFKAKYFDKQKPLIIKNLSCNWPAMQKWKWDYFKEKIGDVEVGIYNNTKSDPYTPVNKADMYTSFGQYINMLQQGDTEWRIFLFNLFNYAPELVNDFKWPDHLLKNFVKRVPMLFVGGKGSITHMHFDMDLSDILHTQFAGSKRILLFPYEEQYKLYRKPFEVMTEVDFSNYWDKEKCKIDYRKFPALKQARGYELVLGHGETLFMPGGFWHHMEYMDNGFALSLRSVQTGIKGKLKGAWYLTGMRGIDTMMKKTAPEFWYRHKLKSMFEHAGGS